VREQRMLESDCAIDSADAAQLSGRVQVAATACADLVRHFPGRVPRRRPRSLASGPREMIDPALVRGAVKGPPGRTSRSGRPRAAVIDRTPHGFSAACCIAGEDPILVDLG